MNAPVGRALGHCTGSSLRDGFCGRGHSHAEHIFQSGAVAGVYSDAAAGMDCIGCRPAAAYCLFGGGLVSLLPSGGAEDIFTRLSLRRAGSSLLVDFCSPSFSAQRAVAAVFGCFCLWYGGVCDSAKAGGGYIPAAFGDALCL